MGMIGTEIGNFLAARISQYARPAKAFVSQPEPKSIGLPRRGAQLIAGNFLFAGHLVETPETSIWDAKPPVPEFEAEVQGFEWLDNLVAEGSGPARRLAKDWTFEWIEKYGAGAGVGWSPQLAGRRVVRWINHALLLLQNVEPEQSKQFFRSVGQQASFLNRRWKAAPEGLPRFEALTGLAYCGLALEMRRGVLTPTIKAIGTECEAYFGPDGSIPSRNPEELANLFTLLTWAAAAITDAGRTPHKEHLLALERIVPTLRALRMGDGGLAQFHGGSRGIEGRLDASLVNSAIRLDARQSGGMGYGRLSQGGTTILLDAGEQAITPAMHNSAMAFEMSSGRQNLIINVGPGGMFDSSLAQSCADTLAHSTLNIGQETPKADTTRKGKEEPTELKLQRQENADFAMLVAHHHAYQHSHGMTHYRTIELAKTGRFLRGRDRVVAESDTDRRKYDRWMKANNKRVMPLFVHFHLAPEVEVELGMQGKAVSLTLPSGEIWVFQTKDGKVAVKDSAYMQTGRLAPRATKQVVVTARAVNYEGVVNWTLTCA